MAVFAKSLFQSVVDRLAGEGPVVDDGPPSGISVRGLSSGFVAETRGPAGLPPVFEDWLEAPTDDGPAADAFPAHRLLIDEIAEDLGLTIDDGEAEIQGKRRAFARLNHPDRVAPEHHEAATMRMKIANMLCDAALDRLARPQRGG